MSTSPSRKTMSRIDELKIRAKKLQKSLSANNKEIKLKEALNKIASLNGFTNWRDLKHKLEETELFLNRATGPSTLHWYSTQEEARYFVKTHGGYIIPYQTDFFAGDDDYLASLGIDKNDADLKLVGQDWSEPNDAEAFKRLQNKIRAFRDQK
ncbi:glyoxalase superfamily protein [Bdellovibrio svalbardensis]|uniref:Glyoxalase superfamily protein n=1 Tax=Bdellovibrio svalbardensis TaxID=2972972 RepID=A0ABT6DID0_9BACT|nr:glyoxalase superfamily protein [Bdellovibrio svalbardensis]MDG0816607.1 glyoxalase superfamily protein [Bdellovibrio svalbardensis]